MFNFFKHNIPKIEGEVLPDPRTEEEKDRDYQAEEIVAFGIPVWIEKPRNEWRKFPIFDQDGSYSCVANAVAKLLGIENFLEEGKFVHLSPRDIYTQRLNRPAAGMWFSDGMSVGYKKGATIEQLMPSMEKSETEMNDYSDRKVSDEQLALVLKGGNYFSVPIDIDNIAQLYPKGVVIGVKFWYDEYNRPDPQILRTDTPPYHHAITVVDYTLYKGKKCLVIDDSWGIDTGWNGQRVISKDWFDKGRVSAAWYYEKLNNNWRDKTENDKPHYQFDKDLIYGMRNTDVIMLQNCLKWEEVFPINQVSTGYFGNVTAKAVLNFWLKYNIATQEEIDNLKGRRVGPKSRAKLNELF